MDSVLPPDGTGSEVIAASVPEKNFVGSSAIRYRTFVPPPQYSYVMIHLPSVVGVTVVMPGRPPPISVLPLPMFTVEPGTSTTGLLQAEALVPAQVRCIRTWPPESVAVALSGSRVGAPVPVS